jgi:hypothetical protein
MTTKRTDAQRLFAGIIDAVNSIGPTMPIDQSKAEAFVDAVIDAAKEEIDKQRRQESRGPN